MRFKILISKVPIAQLLDFYCPNSTIRYRLKFLRSQKQHDFFNLSVDFCDYDISQRNGDVNTEGEVPEFILNGNAQSSKNIVL